MSNDNNSIYTCAQCPKIFATRSNLKRHMENPNIHNLPYARSRDQKRWRGHTKKNSSRAETTERMRKWRAENRDKNKRNDLRCRVYRLARQKFGEVNTVEKQKFIEEEIIRGLGRRMLLEQRNIDRSNERNQEQTLTELPFYCEPLHQIELPSINMTERRLSQSSTEPSDHMSLSPCHQQQPIALPPMNSILSSCLPNLNMLPPLRPSVT